MDFDALKKKAQAAISDAADHTDSASDRRADPDRTEGSGADDQTDYQNQLDDSRPTDYQSQPDDSGRIDYQNQPDGGDHRSHHDG